MLLYGINSIVFCMIKGHLEIVCRTKFHMSVGKTKFYAMKLACACIVIIINAGINVTSSAGISANPNAL